MHCIQHSRFTKQDGWRLFDLSLSLSGNIAVTGLNKNTDRTSLDVYSPVRNSDSRDKPKIFYSKEFDKYKSEGKIYYGRRVSFVDSYDDNRGLVVVTGLGDKLEVFDLNQDRVLKSRKVTLVNPGEIRCLSVREREIFIGFTRSNKITVYDVTDLNEIKSIILQGIQDGYWPYDMALTAERIFLSVGDGKEGSDRRSLFFDQKNGKILSELTKPTDTRWYTDSVTVCVALGVVAVVWHDTYKYTKKTRFQIVFYSLFSANNSSFLIVEIKSGVLRIRISDRGDRMVTMNQWTGEVKVYDMAEVFTYSHLKEKLASTLQTDDCTSLANFFKIPKDQTDLILSSDNPSENLLALEERGVLQPYNVDRLIEAFAELKINPFCQHVAEIYQNTRAQSTLYGRFLATLSAHLTASLPADLCDYFCIADDKKASITSSQNPGLSLLLALDEMGVIKVSEVGALEQPFTEMQMVQAVAKVHEYQALVVDDRQLQRDTVSTKEGKLELFIQYLQNKIKSWYKTMTPVPWKKSCRWAVSDLFISSSLTLIDSSTDRTQTSAREDIKLQYTEIFSHERLKAQIRIVLEGDPGSGKTILMSQLAFDWSQGNFSEIRLLILLPLKLVEQKTLVQAIKDFYVPDDNRLSVNDIEYFLTNVFISTCLLLDGLEEYNSGVGSEEQSEVHKVMSKVKYPTCKVVLSSRTDYAQNMQANAVLKLGKFGETERNSYIQKLMDDPQKQLEVGKVVEDNPFILDFCSTPLLFVLVVHNIEKMESLQAGRLDKVAPFVNSMVNTLCPPDTLVRRTQGLTLGNESEDKITLEDLAFNGLCRGYQQLYWQKEFLESRVRESKKWVDSGILVVEEGTVAASLVRNDLQLHKGSTAAVRSDLQAKTQVDDSSKLSSGAATLKQSDDKAEPKSALPVDVDSTKDPEVAVGQGSTRVQNKGTASDAEHFPLQVRFLHKVIQEWFAAKCFALRIAKLRDKHLQQRYLNEHLPLINPSDLHLVLRFTVAHYPPCCHFIIKHLLTYQLEEGGIPLHVMDCIFLCFAEYKGEYKQDILGVVAAVCKEEITIHSEDSRLLQQAKRSLLEVASSHGILIQKLLLADAVVSTTEDILMLNSDDMLVVIDTLEVLEISCWKQNLGEEDFVHILSFIAKCPLLKKASFHCSVKPPRLSRVTLNCLQEEEKTVTWMMKSEAQQMLDTKTGEWKLVTGSEDLSTALSGSNASSGWNEQTTLETKGIMSRDGGVVEIPGTGVKLDIPPDALPERMDQCTISMRIVPPDYSDTSVIDFSSNCSVVVELLPNYLTFQHPVKLTLPHCLQLKKGAEYKATIFISHHEEGTEPHWEEQTSQSYELTDTTCTMLIDSFCWVKFTIDGKIVEAKRIQVFAAGRPLSLWDKSYDAEVGYYPDLPGGGEKLRSNKNLVVAAKKSFLFYKEGEEPLRILIQKIVPGEWKHLQDEESPMEIPFECVALSEERSCLFVFVKHSEEPLIPLFIFRPKQGDRGFRLLDRPKVLENE